MDNTIIKVLKSTKRAGIDGLVNYMLNESDFLEAPSSSQHHGCKNGGLAEHSINVLNYMLGLYRYTEREFGYTLDNIPEESISIVSLLHDLGKSSYRGKPNYVPNILKSGKVSEAKPFEVNTERLSIPHEVVSLQIASKFIDLTDEEEFAILYHNGLHVASGRDIQGKERPLQQLLHFSDMWASRFMERSDG